MLFSRTSAFFLAFVCIILLSWGSIALLQTIGTTITHGRNVLHNDGTIVTLDEKKQDIVLMTTAGVRMQFRCAERCLVERDHIVRHIRERAHTDVYYMETPDAMLVATDVD